MKTRTLTLALLGSVAAIAGAQDSAVPNGTWHGEIILPAGNPAEVLMHVESGGGTWIATPRGAMSQNQRGNPCFGRPLPIAIATTNGAVQIHIQASKAVQGCTDSRATVRLIDDRHLEGAFVDKTPLKLQRR